MDEEDKKHKKHTSLRIFASKVVQKKRYEHVSYAQPLSLVFLAEHTKEKIITVFYAKEKKKLRMLLFS